MSEIGKALREISQNCQNAGDALEFIHQLTSASSKVDSEDILIIKIVIQNDFVNSISTQHEKLSGKSIKKSFVALLVSKNGSDFKIIWKSSKIEHALCLKNFKHNVLVEVEDLCDLIVHLLANSLTNEHLGIKDIHQNYFEVELHDLVDLRGYNLLLTAAESGKENLIEFLLKYGLPWKSQGNDEITAQLLAQQGKHWNVLLKLFQENLPFPPSLDINDCSDELRKFIEMSVEFHKMIKSKNKEKLDEIIRQNPNLRHFYNLSNKSALNIALDNELIDIYEFLISKNLSFGPDEKIDGIVRFLGPKDKSNVHKIHLKYTKPLPSSHIDMLMTNTTLTHDEVDGEGKRQIVLRAYKLLNEDPILQVILRAAAASKDLHIVFDFFKDSTVRFDPWTSEGTKGIFYFNGQITIGAKLLLDVTTENEVLGTLAHELCHLAVFATYQNNAKPYKSNDQQAEDDLGKIIAICEQKKDVEKYIRLVYDSYYKSQHPSELIVRPAHLIALYRCDQETLRQRRATYPELFDYFENVVIPAIESAIPDIEKRLVYKSIQTFGELPEKKKMVVKNGGVIYKNVKVKLSDLFYENNEVYEKLTSEHISQLLEGEILNFDDPHLLYIEKFINFKFENLVRNLKNKILSSNMIFEGEVVKFREMNSKYPELLKKLTSDQIKSILSGSELIFGEKLQSDVKFYEVRNFIPEDSKIIGFEYEYGHEYVYDYSTEQEHVKNRKLSKTLQEFTDQFLQQTEEVRSEIFDKVKKNLFFKTRYFNFNHEFFKFMHKNSKEIIEIAKNEKIYILSSEPGAGKTVTFENLAIEIKAIWPILSVLYIDLKKHTNLYKSKLTAENLLEKILNLNSKSEFEKEIFEEAFKSGNVVLLWNGFDEISPTYNEFVLNLMKSIHENTKNIQFMCTRPLYSDQLSTAFKVKTWQLVPFNENEKFEFLRKILVSQNIPDDKINENISKISEIIQKFQFEDSNFAYKFNTPLMLKLVAEIYEHKNLSEIANLYQIFDNFIDKKIEIWLERSKASLSKAKSVRLFGVIEKIYQKFALLENLHLYMNTTLGLKMRKLQIMQTEIPDDLPFEEISSMGILYINGKNNFEFAHKTFSEFFVAQFFIESIYNSDNNVDNDEAELRLELFFKLLQDYGNLQKIITDFMSSYLDIESRNFSKNFSEKISELLRTKFRKFFIRMLDTNYPEIFKFLFKFFRKDHSLLVDLLHVHEDETFYTAILNPNYFAQATNPEEIKSLARNFLTNDEFQKFLSGKNQKGKILYGMHFYGLLGITKGNELYDSEVEALNGSSFWNFFDKFNENLSVDEQKELFVTAASPKIYLFYDEIFKFVDCSDDFENASEIPENSDDISSSKSNDASSLVESSGISENDHISTTSSDNSSENKSNNISDFSHYENLWTNYENVFSQNEMQKLIGNLIIQYYETNPSVKIGQEKFLNLFLKKAEKFLPTSKIFEVFFTKNILHEAHWDPNRLVSLFNFLKDRTNLYQRRRIFQQDDLDDKNFYFYVQFDELKEQISSYRYRYFYYDFTKFKIFHRSMTVPSALSFYYTMDLYHESFTISEIQNMILSSNDFVFYAIGRLNEEPFRNFCGYLEFLFRGNEKELKEFLEQKIKSTNLSVFEFVEDFRGLPYSDPSWFENLKILIELYDRIKIGENH